MLTLPLYIGIFVDDPLFRIIKKEVVKHPIRIALLWRFSCFPELVKNFGLAVMPLNYKFFLLACLIHGGPYTVLWSKAGAEAVAAIDGGEQSKVVKIILTLSAVFGLVFSPMIVACWLNNLRNRANKKTDGEIRGGGGGGGGIGIGIKASLSSAKLV